jgi:hypothetical protein
VLLAVGYELKVLVSLPSGCPKNLKEGDCSGVEKWQALSSTSCLSGGPWEAGEWVLPVSLK